MDFLRFGGFLPGKTWGCCAIDIIQDLSTFHPSDPCAVPLVQGDDLVPLRKNNRPLYLGPTYEDVFWKRLRIGTFSTSQQPSRMFLCAIAHSQLRNTNTKAWMKLLEKAGFEFVRSVQNSVYPLDDKTNRVHLFALFRNFSDETPLVNDFTPPESWEGLNFSDSLQQQEGAGRDIQKSLWDEMPDPPFIEGVENIPAGVPVWSAPSFDHANKPKNTGPSKRTTK